MATTKLVAAPDRKSFSLLFAKPRAKAGSVETDLPPGRWRISLRGADRRGREFLLERIDHIDDGVVRYRAGTETIDFALAPRQKVLALTPAPDRSVFTLIFPNGPSHLGSTKTDLPPGRYRIQLRGAFANGKPFSFERTETIRNGVVWHRAGVDTIDFLVLSTG